MKEIKNVKDGKYTSPLTGKQIPATANPNAVYAGRDVRVDVIKKTVTFIESGKTVPLADAIANLKFPEFDESGRVDKNSLKEGFEWWHPLVSLAGGVGLALLPFFAVLGPGMILHPNALVPGDSWADVYRHYKKKFKDKRTAKKLTNEDVLEFIKFIEDNVSELPSGVQKWMKGLINKLKAEMNKDEEELDKNKLLVLMRDVENYAKRKGVKIDNAINEEAAPKFSAKEFVAYVNDEFDPEVLQLMQNVLDDRLKFLNTMQNLANPRTVVKGFQMNKQDLKEAAKTKISRKRLEAIVREEVNTFLTPVAEDKRFVEVVQENVGTEVQGMVLEIAEAFGYKGGKIEKTTVTGLVREVLDQIPTKERKGFLIEVTKLQQIYGVDEIIL